MTDPVYEYLPAGARLAHLAEGGWRLRSEERGKQVIAPDGRCELIVHAATPPRELRVGAGPVRQPRAFLYGPLTRVLVIEQDADMDVMGLRLHPWAVGALSPRPAELRDRLSVLAPLGFDLPGARSLEAFMDTADARLANVPLPEASHLARQVISCMEAGTVNSLEDAARRAEVSVRTLNRHFERCTGLTAAFYLRLARFHRARTAIKGGATSLVEAALAAGYADQPHMTRDFRRFAGETPRLVRDPATFDPLYH